jgi:hypothetical protein
MHARRHGPRASKTTCGAACRSCLESLSSVRSAMPWADSADAAKVVHGTPLGWPVEPEVYMIMAKSLGCVSRLHRLHRQGVGHNVVPAPEGGGVVTKAWRCGGMPSGTPLACSGQCVEFANNKTALDFAVL